MCCPGCSCWRAIVHAYIHVTSNRLDRRTGVFGVGAIALLLMWVIVIARITLFASELMTPGARASAAIEVLADIEARKRPASEALKDWGLSHRFAGSGDRAAIGNLVFDACARAPRAPMPWARTSPRALVLQDAGHGLGQDARGGRGPRRWGPPCAGAVERRPSLPGWSAIFPADAPAGNIAATIRSGFRRNSSEPLAPGPARRGRRSRERAPVDLRVNTLKADARQGAEGAAPFRCGADAAFARRRAHRAGAEVRDEPSCRGRARSRQGLVRGAGRRLAARRAAFRRQAEDSRSSIFAPGPAARPWRSRR